MEFKIQVPTYEKKEGFIFDWEEDFKIEVKIINEKVLINANKDGLISLARHLLNLSQGHFDFGYSIHLDSYNSLEDTSNELIIQKI